MAKTNVSDYRFSIYINNDQAKRSLIEMEKVMAGYEAELAKLVREKKQDTQQYRDAKKVYEDHLEQMKKLRQEAGLQALSLKELKSLRSQLNNELARAIPGTEHRQKLIKEFGAVNARISELQSGAQQTGLSLGKVADGFNRYFAMATAGIAAVSGLAMAIRGMIQASGDLSDSLANIRKTTGMTAREAEQLNAAFGKIDTRTSRQELRDMAVIGGQLGMAKDDIFSFVESVDRLNVALGDEFTGGAEQVAKEMGMLRNVLTDLKTDKVSEDILRVGNAINTLGAAGFATGPVMSDFASRIGGIGIPLGLTSDEVLGMSATLQELNVNAERGGTAVVKILQKMTNNTETFAAVAGMKLEDFTNLVNSDLYGAFLKVIEGSQRGGQSATTLAGIIKELEISGAGASEIFAKLGGNTAMLAEKVALAGTALQGTGSITSEFNIKNETLGAVLDKLGKEFNKLITMPGVTEFFKNQVYHVMGLIGWFKDLPLIVEKYRIALIAVAGATGVWVAAKTRSLQISLLNTLTLKEGILLKAKDAIVMEYLIIKEQMLTVWKANGTTATKLATTAQILWNAAMKANPIGLVIAAVTALVGAIAAYEKYNSRALSLERLKASTTALLADANKKLEQSYTELQRRVSGMNATTMEEKKQLRELLELKIKNAEADLLSLQSRQKAVGQAAAKPTFWQKATSFQWTVAGQAQSDAYYSWKNSNEAMSPFNDELDKMRQNIAQLKSLKTDVDNIVRAESFGDKIVAKTQEALTEKLSKYQIALRNTVSGSEDYLRIQAKIKQTNKELSQFDNSSAIPGASAKATTRLQELNEKIEQYTALLQVQVEKQPEKAAATAREIVSLNKQKKAIEDLMQAYMALEETTLDNGPLYSFEEVYQFRKNAGIATADEIAWYEIDKLKKTTGWVLANEQERAAAIMKIRKDNGLNTTVLSDGTLVEEWTPDNYEANKKQDHKQQQSAFDAKLHPEGALGVNLWGAKAEQFMGYASTVLGGMTSIDQLMSSFESAQLQRDVQANERKKLNLKRQLDAKLISQKQYDEGILKLDAALEKKQKELQVKQAKRQKALSLVQAIINTAHAVTSALTAGPVLGIILSTLVGALGAIQIGYIAATSVPEAMRGRYRAFLKARQAAMGRYDVLGQEDQQLYRDVPFIPNPSSGIYDRPTLFAETGKEIILNPMHTRNLMRFRPDLVSSIMQVPQRFSGSYPSLPEQDTPQRKLTVGFDPQTLEELQKFRQQLQQPIRSTIVYDHLVDTMDTMDMIRRQASR